MLSGGFSAGRFVSLFFYGFFILTPSLDVKLFPSADETDGRHGDHAQKNKKTNRKQKKNPNLFLYPPSDSSVLNRCWLRADVVWFQFGGRIKRFRNQSLRSRRNHYKVCPIIFRTLSCTFEKITKYFVKHKLLLI